MDRNGSQRLIERLKIHGAKPHSFRVDWCEVRRAYGVEPPEPYKRILETFCSFTIWNEFTILDPFVDAEREETVSIYCQESVYEFHLINSNDLQVATRPSLPEDGSMFAWAVCDDQYLASMVSHGAVLNDVYLIRGAESKFISPDFATLLGEMLEKSIRPPCFSDQCDWDDTCCEALESSDYNELVLSPKYRAQFV